MKIEHKGKKRGRAMVPIGRQCVLLQIYLRIPIVPNCKNIRNWAAKQKKCPKMDTKLKNS